MAWHRGWRLNLASAIQLQAELCFVGTPLFPKWYVPGAMVDVKKEDVAEELKVKVAWLSPAQAGRFDPFSRNWSIGGIELGWLWDVNGWFELISVWVGSAWWNWTEEENGPIYASVKLMLSAFKDEAG